MEPKREKGMGTGRSVRRGIGIAAKLEAVVVGSVVIAVAVLLMVVNGKMSQALLEKSEDLLEAAVERTVQETRAWMSGTLTMLEAQRDVIEYEDMDVSGMMEYIRHTVNQNEAYPAGLYVALTDGSLYHASFVPGPDYDASVKSWYQDGLNSQEFLLGDVYFDEDSQSYVVGASGVLRAGDGSVRGVAAADVYLNSISRIVNGVRIEDTGGIFLVDTRTDTIIGHRDDRLIGRKLGELDEAMYVYAAGQIQSGGTELSLCEGTYIQVEMVPGSDWAAVAYVSQKEVLRELDELTKTMSAVAAAAVVVIILLTAFQIHHIIGSPVRELSRAAGRIAEGELDMTIRCRSRDELGVLADDFNRVTVRLRDYVKYINEISEKLQEIAGGNLAFTLENDYAGEFAKIKSSMERISVELNGTMRQIYTASREVSAGAEQVSGGAVTLSQGSTEQAAEVEALAEHIRSVSDSVQEIAQGAQEASRISGTVRQGLLRSNEKMQMMSEVLQKSSDMSAQMHRIVKTIDDIAFQTNILALNAAVEAARAGESGMGFAVVADEVRVLAAKSSAAAQETTDLLNETIDSMAEGVSAAQVTAQSMLAVAVQADELSGLVEGIAQSTRQQAVNAGEITRGISQISDVVQTNMATAQESAAASEELSGQAASLRELVAGFRLKG